MFDHLDQVFATLIPIVGAIALFSFLAVSSWSEQRRKEREAYYRGEVLKKLIETPGANTQLIIEMMRQEESGALRRRREGLMLGGLILGGVGLGVLVFLRMMVTGTPVWTVGLIPLLIGVMLLVYVLLLAPKPQPPRAN